MASRRMCLSFVVKVTFRYSEEKWGLKLKCIDVLGGGGGGGGGGEIKK